jgi:hypothetical protein
LKPSASGLLILTPLYERMKELGGVVENAPEHPFEDLKVRVVDANYLRAIALQTGRSKDYLRIHTLIESGHVNTVKLTALIQNYNLIERWETYVRRFA